MRDKAAVEHVVVRGDKEVKRDFDRTTVTRRTRSSASPVAVSNVPNNHWLMTRGTMLPNVAAFDPLNSPHNATSFSLFLRASVINTKAALPYFALPCRSAVSQGKSVAVFAPALSRLSRPVVCARVRNQGLRFEVIAWVLVVVASRRRVDDGGLQPGTVAFQHTAVGARGGGVF